MSKREILFLLSHQPNPRFVKQINFLSTRYNVSVLYYTREYMKDLSCEYSNNVVLSQSLGTVSNANYVKRIGKYINSFMQLKKILQKSSYDILIVNNIDTLALFKISTLSKRLEITRVMEISDLRSHTYTEDIASKVMRTIEKYMFRFVDKLIVTSPKFYDKYYKNMFYGEAFILENKPLSTMIPQRLKKLENDKIIIGIVGLLLQGKPYQTLLEATKNDDRYEVHIYGKGIFEDLIKEYSHTYRNIKFFGEYNFFQDSAKIYSTLDILYMPYDTTNGSLNNKVAVPNKLYEAMYFHVPIITSKESYLGELIEGFNIGKTIWCCQKEELLRTLEHFDFDLYLNNFGNLDKKEYLADDDYEKLDRYIKETI